MPSLPSILWAVAGHLSPKKTTETWVRGKVLIVGPYRLLYSFQGAKLSGAFYCNNNCTQLTELHSSLYLLFVKTNWSCIKYTTWFAHETRATFSFNQELNQNQSGWSVSLRSHDTRQSVESYFVRITSSSSEKRQLNFFHNVSCVSTKKDDNYKTRSSVITKRRSCFSDIEIISV